MRSPRPAVFPRPAVGPRAVRAGASGSEGLLLVRSQIKEEKWKSRGVPTSGAVCSSRKQSGKLSESSEKRFQVARIVSATEFLCRWQLTLVSASQSYSGMSELACDCWPGKTKFIAVVAERNTELSAND